MRNNMEIGSIVSLSDNLKYIVTNKINYQEQIYYLIIDINNISNHKIVFFSSNDEVEEIDNPNLLEKIVLLMSKNIINN